ncbi:DUF2628 domain-containing protein [Acuticoccus sp.]|uniref:DUF2628 domain-containing protein n=1 Tax=Acuticoccus sp. TaxID=1904378 RepID=UPI003B521EAC
MTVWTVWEHDRHEGDERALRARLVPDRFSWLAALSPPLWLLARGMGLALLAFAVVATTLVVAAGLVLGPAMALSTALVLMVWFGFEARAVERWSLARRGWSMVAVVEGKRFDQAERRWLAGREPDATLLRAPTGGARATPPVGAAGPWGGSVPPVLGVMPEGPR